MNTREPAAIFTDLRSNLLRKGLDDIRVSPSPEYPTVWGVLMEMGTQSGSATLVVLADRTVSLYLSSGGGIIGAGPREDVWRVAQDVLLLAQLDHQELTRTTSFPLPEAGRTKFYMLTFSGVLTADAKDEMLKAKSHRLSKLYFACHRVIGELRRIRPNW